jgi:hypothetical protein
MLNRTAILATLTFIPLSAIGAPKVKGSVKLQVVSTSTRIHGSYTTHSFAYTDLLFTEMNGKKIVFECVQRGDICPMVESGETYTADQDGAYVRITMNTPEDKKAIAVKFKQVGAW